MSTTFIMRFPSQGLTYDSFVYPAGESQVRLTKTFMLSLNEFRFGDEIRIKARVSSAQDLIELVLLSQAVYLHSMHRQVLELAYMPYGRADRKFVNGDCMGLQFVANLLKSQAWFSRIVTLDMHSGRMMDYFGPRVLVNVEPTEFVKQVLVDIERHTRLDLYGNEPVVLLPDEGAAKRWPRIAGSDPVLNSVRVLAAEKTRDAATGKLSGFKVPGRGAFGGDANPVLIVDDICDGGGTFIGLAQELKYQMPNPLYLYVTHGIFSKGLGVFNGLFDGIYTTDSWCQETGKIGRLTVMPVGNSLMV